MPEMISLRNFRLETLMGHVVTFEANTPKMVPDCIVQDAMAAGCVPVDGSAPYYDDLARAKVEFQGDLRRSMIYLAVKAIAEKNNAKDFDGGGNPKHTVIAQRLGFDLTAKEALSVYQQYMEAKVNDRDAALHPAAANIMRVIEAEDKAELLDLAAEFDVDTDKSKSLTVRELRKLLLVKFNGAALGG